MRLITGAFVAFLCAASAHAQRLGGAPDEVVSLGQILAALMLCLAAACGLALVFKFRAGGQKFALLQLVTGSQQAEHIEVTASKRLSIHAEIHVVRYRQVEYVILCGANIQQVLERRGVAAHEAEAEQIPDTDQNGAG